MRIPNGELSVYASKFLYLLAKASHWETEKAGYKNVDIFVYMVRVTRPALMLSRKCFKSIEAMFSVKAGFAEANLFN